MVRYVLGVDGGNTKTDYLLFDTEGNLIDGRRGGTCSHEGLSDSYAGSYRIMNEEITNLLNKNQLNVSDITAAVFGLAGVDVPSQREKLEEVVRRIGFTKYMVVNDGFLGIKAAAFDGTGVCSINGTGTVSTGIDEEGNIIQVGGIGFVSGDEAGGSFLGRRVVQAAYDEAFRFGEKTVLTDFMFKTLGITDKKDFSNAIVNSYYAKGKVNNTDVVKALFKAGNDGDHVAISILSKAGENMARSVAGCIANLHFEKAVNVVLAGSVWANATCCAMLDSFKKWVNELTGKECHYLILSAPPACGAVIWAIEIATGVLPSQALKDKVLKGVADYQAARNQ